MKRVAVAATLVGEHAAAHGNDPGRRFRQVVGLFGLIWLVNAGVQFLSWVWPPDHGLPFTAARAAQLPASAAASAPPARAVAAARVIHAFAKPIRTAPSWLQPYLHEIVSAVQRIGPRPVALGMVAVALLLGLSLITRIRLAAACWLGLAYSVFCWTTLNALGYPYGGGQTDPGVFVAYGIGFVFVLGVIPILSGQRNEAAAAPNGFWTAGRFLFGLLWAFDAALKWQPYFLTHFMAQITSAADGQPAWIAAYIGLVATVVQWIGPVVVAVAVALVETVLAISLLTGWQERLFVPLGLLYSLAVWSTAEGLGGPYTAAGTGVRGNVLGNVLIYAVIYLFLLVPQLTRRAGPLRAAVAA